MKKRFSTVKRGVFTALLTIAQVCFALNVTSYVENPDGVTFTCTSTSRYGPTFEAENAALSGTAVVATDHTEYGGTGFVAGFINSTTAQALFTIIAPSAGQYSVQIKYSAGNGTASNIGLFINETQTKTLAFTATATWDTWSTLMETVTLNSGSNTIALKSLASTTTCINLDNITIPSIIRTDTGTTWMKVKVCLPDIIHLMCSPTSVFSTRDTLVVTRTWPTPVFTVAESGDTVTLTTGRLKAKVCKSRANVTYTDLNNTVILAESAKSMAATTVESVHTFTLSTSYYSPADEGLYGLGQHMIMGGAGNTVVNYKGKNETLAQEYANPSNTFYTAIPVLMSTMGYGIYFDNYSKSWFYGGDSSNTQYRYVSECGDQLDYYFFYGPELDTVISKYRATTGKAQLFPKWFYGFIQSKDKYTSQAEYLAVKNGYRNNNIPVDCIVQDWQYWVGAGQQGCNCFNSNWTDLNAIINECHTANIHTMLSIWSVLQNGAPLFTTLNNMGALWTSNGDYRFLDAFHASGRETFWNAIKNDLLAKNGWDAWWLDNDEPFPYPSGFDRHSMNTAMGKGALYYNLYTFMMTRTGYNNWRRDIPGKRCVILHRACFAGQQAHSSFSWNNDINCDFATMANSIPTGLHSTITGVPYWCTDIGGYWGHGTDWTTAANRELFTRWFQYGAFQPAFRVHGGGARELYGTSWDAATKANLLLINKLHYRLMPYIYSMAWMVTNSDYTPMRHLVMDFRTDANVKNIGNQYMFGPAFMVSPVTTEGARSRSVYLPAGRWYDFWTGDTVAGIAGRTITANAPLNHLPLYIRAGSIVPMGQEIQYATQRSDSIELRVYRGANGSFTIYEDEGDNYNYETGSYATIPITYNNTTGLVTIGARSGSFTGMQQNKVFSIVFVRSGHGADEPKTTSPDCIINYSGVSVSGCPVGIEGNGPISNERSLALFASFKAADGQIVLGPAFSGKTKSVAVYSLGGKLLCKKTIAKNRLSLQKDMDLSKGVYIVKVRAVE